MSLCVALCVCVCEHWLIEHAKSISTFPDGSQSVKLPKRQTANNQDRHTHSQSHTPSISIYHSHTFSLCLYSTRTHPPVHLHLPPVITGIFHGCYPLHSPSLPAQSRGKSLSLCCICTLSVSTTKSITETNTHSDISVTGGSITERS